MAVSLWNFGKFSSNIQAHGVFYKFDSLSQFLVDFRTEGKIKRKSKRWFYLLYIVRRISAMKEE